MRNQFVCALFKVRSGLKQLFSIPEISSRCSTTSTLLIIIIHPSRFTNTVMSRATFLIDAKEECGDFLSDLSMGMHLSPL